MSLSISNESHSNKITPESMLDPFVGLLKLAGKGGSGTTPDLHAKSANQDIDHTALAVVQQYALVAAWSKSVYIHSCCSLHIDSNR